MCNTIKENPILSIITPSYNRGKLLKKCYESLCNQSVLDFEWIVIDDGSSDDTQNIMKKIKMENSSFDIQYIYKCNGGKHTALNASHPYIRGKYVLILDSDDRLSPDAVEIILNGWMKYEYDKKTGMVIFLKKNVEGQIFAYSPHEHKALDVLHHKRIGVVSSDCCEVLRTELFKKYSFPVFENEKFLAETALWYRVGLEHKCIYINKAVYIAEYLEDGLSNAGRKMRIKNPRGGIYTSYLRMNKRCYISERIKSGLLYVCYSFFAQEKIISIVKNAAPYQFLSIICLVPGYFMYRIWGKKYK